LNAVVSRLKLYTLFLVLVVFLRVRDCSGFEALLFITIGFGRGDLTVWAFMSSKELVSSILFSATEGLICVDLDRYLIGRFPDHGAAGEFDNLLLCIYFLRLKLDVSSSSKMELVTLGDFC